MVTSSKVNVNQATMNRIERHLHVVSAVPEHPVLRYSQHMMPMKMFREKNGTGTSPCSINIEASPSQPI